MDKATEQKIRNALATAMEQTNSRMVKAVLEKVLSRKDFIRVITNILKDLGPNEYFSNQDDARTFYFTHHDEIDTMLREYDNTSIGRIIMEFFEEMSETLAYSGFDHVLRRALENNDYEA